MAEPGSGNSVTPGTATAPNPKELAAFKEYIAEKKVVIADPNKTIRASIARALVDLGGKSHNIVLTSGIEDAAEAIRSVRPDLVFAEYNLDNRCGLELVQVHRSNRADPENILFILVTANAAESAVAEAAEEDVDSYILKPFNMEVLKNYIVKAAANKVRPNPYRAKIARGKEFLLSNQLEQAIATFREAKSLTDAPSLACYYEGQSFERKERPDFSELCYEEGLMYNEIHYKCSVGLFDLWARTGKSKEAYELARKITRYFPLNPQRLGKTLELAVRTQNFEDLGQYFEMFTKLQERREDLRKYVCAALIVGAIFQFRHDHPEQALDLMNKAGVTAAGSPNLLKEIVLTVVENGYYQAAEGFLKRFPLDTVSTPQFQVAEYALIDKTLPIGEVIMKGRSLIKAGVHEPLIYQVLIRRTLEAGYVDTAESLAHDAGRRWPDQKEKFLSLLSPTSLSK